MSWVPEAKIRQPQLKALYGSAQMSSAQQMAAMQPQQPFCLPGQPAHVFPSGVKASTAAYALQLVSMCKLHEGSHPPTHELAGKAE